MIPGKPVRMRSREVWRRWLERQHASKTEVWLAYYKTHTRKPSVTYVDAVEEALCFGWIDGQMQRIDDESWVQRFSPRRPGSAYGLRATGYGLRTDLESGVRSLKSS